MKTTKKVVKLSQNPCLEEILQFLNGEKDKMFLKEIVKDGEGNVIKWGTKKGEKTYEKLISLLFGIGQLCQMEKEMAGVVEELDEIIESDGSTY